MRNNKRMEERNIRNKQSPYSRKILEKAATKGSQKRKGVENGLL